MSGGMIMPRFVSNLRLQPGDERKYPIARQYVFAVRAQAIFSAVLIENMPERFKQREWAQAILATQPLVDSIKPAIGQYEWSAGMKRSFKAFLDVVNDEVWDDEWGLRTIERHYLKMFFAADSLVCDVTGACDYYAREVPAFRQLRDVLTGLIDGILSKRTIEAGMGYRVYERIRLAAG